MSSRWATRLARNASLSTMTFDAIVGIQSLPPDRVRRQGQRDRSHMIVHQIIGSGGKSNGGHPECIAASARVAAGARHINRFRPAADRFALTALTERLEPRLALGDVADLAATAAAFEFHAPSFRCDGRNVSGRDSGQESASYLRPRARERQSTRERAIAGPCSDRRKAIAQPRSEVSLKPQTPDVIADPRHERRLLPLARCAGCRRNSSATCGKTTQGYEMWGRVNFGHPTALTGSPKWTFCHDECRCCEIRRSGSEICPSRRHIWLQGEKGTVRGLLRPDERHGDREIGFVGD